MLTLQQLNQTTTNEFVKLLGDVFEHSSWIAEKASAYKPFYSLLDLYQHLISIVKNASSDEKLNLIKAHPRLGFKIQMSPNSTKEQQEAGLQTLSPDEARKFLTLNQHYQTKFGFPFIIAVKGKDKSYIYQMMKERIQYTKESEFENALAEIFKIAWFRLQEKVKGDLTMKNKSAQKTLCYGKGDVFAYRTYARPLTGIPSIPESNFTERRNIIFGTNVKVAVCGKDFIPSFTEGDNSLVVATDSMKNFIQRHLGTYEGSTLEGFVAYVSEAFLKKYPQMESVKLIAEEIPFETVSENSSGSIQTSHLVFKQSRNERSQALVEVLKTKNGYEIQEQSSSILDLQLIKVSGNSFVGFIRDEYTTLPEDGNRPLFIYLNLHWVYEEQTDAFGSNPKKYVAAEQIIDIATSVFHGMETPSIQNLIYEIGCRILTRFPQLLEVTFESQNHTWDTVVSAIPGSNGKVYTEPRPPYGFQVFTVTKELMKEKKSKLTTENSLG